MSGRPANDKAPPYLIPPTNANNTAVVYKPLAVYSLRSTSPALSHLASPHPPAMTHIHPASQIESSKHSKTVLELTELPVNQSLIGKRLPAFRWSVAVPLTLTLEHIVRETADTVNLAIGSPSCSRSRSETRRSESEAARFAEFAADVIGRAEVPTAVLLVALVYIHRSRPHLSIEAKEWAFHRVFLGALMLASKVCTFQTIIPSWSGS
jgi:hypothetical protein